MNAILVNSNQRGNPILSFINSQWEYAEPVADYQVGRSTGLLFLSLKYNRLHPEYLTTRLSQIHHNYSLRILLCLVDVDDNHNALREISAVCIRRGVTLLLAWSEQEAGQYIETLKAYECKSADSIKERINDDYHSKLTDALTCIKSVNKTDVLTLLSNLGSLKKMASASTEELLLLPGFAESKVRRFKDAFSKPFLQ